MTLLRLFRRNTNANPAAADPAPAEASPPRVDVSPEAGDATPASPAESTTRFERITAALDKSGKGLEIGPSHNPIMAKRDGYDVETVDHLDQQGLIDKYREHGIDLSRIEPVDYVWTGQSLPELIGQTGRYDWIIASHVIEHAPDVVGFLQQCLQLLKPNGVLSLVVPDRRYCFDYLRFPSTTGAMVQAHLEHRRRHSPGQLVDYVATVSNLQGRIAWNPDDGGPVAFSHSLEQAGSMLSGYLTHEEYVDMHGWVFTPSSFRLAMSDLNALGLIQMREVGHFGTHASEFSFSYSPGKDDRTVDRLALCKRILDEIINERLS